MDLTPNQLPARGYILLEALPHDALIPLIRRGLALRTIYVVVYYMANVLAIALGAWYIGRALLPGGPDFEPVFAHLAYGIGLAFALLPVHEYIHVLAYRLQGARHTSYAAALRRFYFMALADGFVADVREFAVIGLAPFVVITVLLLALWLVLPAAWAPAAAGALIAHTAMCSGDFGLLSYMHHHRHQGIVTYDDVRNKVSYFYVAGEVKYSSL